MSNIATVMWAIVAYILTVSSMDPKASGSLHIIGPAIACAWLWLLPLVVGWMQISPNCDEAKLKKELAMLNEAMFIAVGDSGSTASPALARECTNRFPIEVWPPRRSNAHKAGEFVAHRFIRAIFCSCSHQILMFLMNHEALHFTIMPGLSLGLVQLKKWRWPSSLHHFTPASDNLLLVLHGGVPMNTGLLFTPITEFEMPPKLGHI
jgi:hypothetical protein